MTIIKKCADNNYYIIHKPKKGYIRNWFLGKESIPLTVVRLPKELWGKHIRFKIEIV